MIILTNFNINEFCNLINLNQMQLICFIRVFIAAICGSIIGFERRRRQKDAGIRTHVIVAMGACLMMILSKYGFSDLYGPNSEAFDASRMAAQVVSGVGFLGAGMIFVNKHKGISGLTTAAGIWTTSGISMAIGDGMYFLGIAVTVLIIIFQWIFHTLIKNAENGIVQDFQIIIKEDYEYIDEISKVFKDNEIKILESKITKSNEKIILDYSIVFESNTYEKIKTFVFNNEKIIGFTL